MRACVHKMLEMWKLIEIMMFNLLKCFSIFMVRELILLHENNVNSIPLVWLFSFVYSTDSSRMVCMCAYVRPFFVVSFSSKHWHFNRMVNPVVKLSCRFFGFNSKHSGRLLIWSINLARLFEISLAIHNPNDFIAFWNFNNGIKSMLIELYKNFSTVVNCCWLELNV